MRLFFLQLALLLTLGMTSCQSTAARKSVPLQSDQDLSQYSVAYFASGCFWCVEAIFESVKGVEEAISGYTGGKENNPTYQQVSAGRTTHAEAVAVYYNPEVISYTTLLEVFFGSHDPTTLNRQGPDKGTQYRSGIYYQTEEEKTAIVAFLGKLDAKDSFSSPITTEIAELSTFWPAEDYHQNYERLNPNQSYVRAVSIPRLNRFKKKFPELLKKEKH